jgi:DNA-binding MarR family transcriptional regulator
MNSVNTQSSGKNVKTQYILEDVSFYLVRAFYEFRGLVERNFVEVGVENVLQQGMGKILFALYEKDNCTISEISARTQLAPSTLTGLIEKMVTCKLITRCKDEHDGRAVRIRLTELGQSVKGRLYKGHDIIMDILQGDMSDKEFNIVSQGLMKMVNNMRNHQEQWNSRQPLTSNK